MKEEEEEEGKEEKRKKSMRKERGKGRKAWPTKYDPMERGVACWFCCCCCWWCWLPLLLDTNQSELLLSLSIKYENLNTEANQKKNPTSSRYRIRTNSQLGSACFDRGVARLSWNILDLDGKNGHLGITFPWRCWTSSVVIVGRITDSSYLE